LSPPNILGFSELLICSNGSDRNVNEERLANRFHWRNELEIEIRFQIRILKLIYYKIKRIARFGK